MERRNYVLFLLLSVSLMDVCALEFGKTGDQNVRNRNLDVQESNYLNVSKRRKRYLGLSKRFKINRRYQECIAPGDVQGHCKHLHFCQMGIFRATRGVLDYLCVIEKTHVGVCGPDDIAQQNVVGSLILMDLPGGAIDYDDDENISSYTVQQLRPPFIRFRFIGCGFRPEASYKASSNLQWPWIVALRRPTGVEQNFCSGTVITDQHILTAAHCLEGFFRLTVNNVTVRLGEYDFTHEHETRFRDFKVAEIISHEEFNYGTYDNDIAILKLHRQIAFSTYIWPICLPPFNRSYVNETAIVAGWGRQNYSGPTSDVLLEVAIPVWEHEKCVDAFAQAITENSLCAAGYEGGNDSCLGDSGGPLLYLLENGRWITIGIVSWGIGCGSKGYPGIYTRVDKYLPWIIQHTITL